MSTVNTVVVHRCQDDIEASQIRDVLAQEGIPCQVVSNVPHTVLPLTTDGLGEVRIVVREDHAARASELIQLFLSDGQPVVEESLPDEAPRPMTIR